MKRQAKGLTDAPQDKKAAAGRIHKIAFACDAGMDPALWVLLY